uniref:Photosystem II Psb31 protein domain-containing protein n=1 Tax=Heterosigma akashiwo TaxID=2829 RepID=A0A6V1UIU7_HETAK|eukprot:CAMPEP_0194559024 /NCGR_PEP_ID=MMETSP0292-20121207/722_1 /TAXON_ID=39354 /ORGANISM="Heterosigma akashiwo, Strain CCMP2393" /LENGTH=193 /DNA_ID=CAMNT_0039406825 /DNA_START=78 /DNA_END=659 /DNA_ORIENTATION=-
MYKIICLALALIACVQAFVAPMQGPASGSRVVMQMEGRREFLNAAFGAAVVAGAAMPAFADGAVSTATVQRARGIYGGRIEDLKSAVDAGNIAAVAEEINAFKLFASGAYAKKSPADKASQKLVNAAIAEIEDGIKTNNAGKVKSGYAKVIEAGELNYSDFKYDGKDRAYSQGYSSDFDWKKGDAKKGTIYVR